MRYHVTLLTRTAATVLAIAALTSAAAAQRPTRNVPPSRSQVFDLGKGMSAMNADLILVAARSAMFLQFSEQIGLTAEQQKKLEEIYFEVQQFSVRRRADLDVADAELRRLLSSERVDLAAVKLKLKEVEGLRAEETLKSIEAVLQALQTLTHGQHIKIMLLVRGSPTEDQATRPVS